jgi:glycosyltransferase involved in cell wall biosynthesis
LSEPKDYPNLLNAYAQIENDLPDTRLLIAGPGPLKEVLQEQIRQLGLEEKATLLGMRDDVFSLFCAADVYAMSSAWEGMPLVILEAMACERMVVATDCGGVKEVMADAGVLVAPHDTPALATALNRALCMSEDDRSVIGHVARLRILEHYSLEAVADKWLLIYSGHMQLEYRVNP